MGSYPVADGGPGEVRSREIDGIVRSGTGDAATNGTAWGADGVSHSGECAIVMVGNPSTLLGSWNRDSDCRTAGLLVVARVDALLQYERGNRSTGRRDSIGVCAVTAFCWQSHRSKWHAAFIIFGFWRASRR